jgi:hypothetical protein
MPTALEPGELLVWEVLRSELPEEWEIYREPYVNGKRPDFAVMRAGCGVVLIEVKDSPFVGSARRHVERHVGCARKQAVGVRTRLCSCVPRLNQLSWVELRTVVVYPFADVGIWESGREQVLCSGEMSWAVSLIDEIRKSEQSAGSSKFDEDLAEEIRRWFVEPEMAREQRVPIRLDPSQREIAINVDGQQRRRVRGVSGSGKSETLVARAIELSRGGGGQAVLVICFNLVLVNYLSDRLRAYGRQEGVAWDRVTVLNWHAWAGEATGAAWKQMCHSRDLHSDVAQLRDPPELGMKVEAYLKQCQRSELDLYDAVLVDEGQDLPPSCIRALQQVLKDPEHGELLVAADFAQDIYGRGADWSQQVYSGLGFSGRWKRLESSHRLPAALVEIVRWYQESERLDVESSWDELSVPEQLSLAAPRLQWVQLRRGDEITEAVNRARDEMFRSDGGYDADSASWADLVIACSSKADGSLVAESLRGQGLNVSDTFADSVPAERVKKTRLYKGAAAIKVTTPHSLKGLSVTRYILVLDEGAGGHPEMVLSAISRLKAREFSTAMTVICADETLRGLGQRFPMQAGL